MRTNLTNGYVTGCAGAFAAFTTNGALIGRFGLKREAMAAVEAPLSDAAKIRQALISELGANASAAAQINAYSDTELADWASILIF